MSRYKSVLAVLTKLGSLFTINKVKVSKNVKTERTTLTDLTFKSCLL